MLRFIIANALAVILLQSLNGGPTCMHEIPGQGYFIADHNNVMIVTVTACVGEGGISN